MANWDDTELTCSNPEVVKAIATAVEEADYNGMKLWKDGDIELQAHTRIIPHDKVKEISKQFPDDVITCRYSFDADMFSEIHVVEYRNGKDDVVDIEPGYMFSRIPLNKNADREAIHTKAVSFFRRLETKEKDKEGNLTLKWFNEEVCYKFEHDGEDGKKYRVEATKWREQIDLKVFEGLVKYDWREITDAQVNEECPF